MNTENEHMQEEEVLQEEQTAEEVVAESTEETTEETVEKTPEENLSPLEQAQQEAGENLAGWKRCMADYQNLQKDTETRVADARKFGTQTLLLDMLPMVDHFKYAMKGMPEEMAESGWVKGVEYIQSNFMKILEENGLEVIETVGKELDTEVMEAMEEVETAADGSTGKSGTVAEEVSTGFRLHGKVIQVAKVKVFK